MSQGEHNFAGCFSPVYRVFRPNDPTPLPSGDGTRRYLCVEVTKKVDMSGQIPYKQMFAQAVAELRNPDCIYWFTSDDEREIQQHNSQYQQESAPELVLSQLFEPAAQHSRDNFWTAPAMLLFCSWMQPIGTIRIRL